MSKKTGNFTERNNIIFANKGDMSRGVPPVELIVNIQNKVQVQINFLLSFNSNKIHMI